MPQAWRKGNGGKVFTLTRCSATSVIGKRHNHDTSSIEQPSSGVTARILILKGNEKWAGLSHSFLRVRRWLFWQVRSWLRARLPRARPVALLPMGLTHAQRAPSLRSEVDGPDGRCVKRLSARREIQGAFLFKPPRPSRKRKSAVHPWMHKGRSILFEPSHRVFRKSSRFSRPWCGATQH